MNRRLSRGLRVPLFLLMVFVLINCDGCGGGGSGPGPIVGNRNYGPPLYDVLFLDGQDYIATINPEGGTSEFYVKNVGNNQDLSTPGLGVLYKITAATSETTNLLVYDNSTHTLNILDSYGEVLYTYDNIVDNYYDASESRIARIAIIEGGYQLQTSRWESMLPLYTMGAVESPYFYASRPSLNASANRAVIAIHNSEDSSVDRIAVMGEYDFERSTLNVTGLAPQYSPESDEMIAYLEAPNGPELATNLVIVDGSLDTELGRFNFGQYGVGATSFSWSPNGNRIALYAGAFGPDPQLVIINVSQTLVVSYDLGDYTISLGEGDDMVWAFPEWNNESTELILPAKIDLDGTTSYHIVKFNFQENTTNVVSTKATQSTHPHWRKYNY